MSLGKTPVNGASTNIHQQVCHGYKKMGCFKIVHMTGRFVNYYCFPQHLYRNITTDTCDDRGSTFGLKRFLTDGGVP